MKLYDSMIIDDCRRPTAILLTIVQVLHCTIQDFRQCFSLLMYRALSQFMRDSVQQRQGPGCHGCNFDGIDEYPSFLSINSQTQIGEPASELAIAQAAAYLGRFTGSQFAKSIWNTLM